ncbi:MAG TPA: NADH-quinone oxidoreductase subunit L [Candidatus Omnitrophota bacterium]|nr:NADH-quinone oxidoreductase subunit L [Candidatus Omnitrophota bacterium]
MAQFIPLFPFLAFVINIFFGKRLNQASAWVSIVASGMAMLVSIQTFFEQQAHQNGSIVLGEWLSLYGVPLKFGVTVDALSVMMLLVVTIVATLIKIYSVGYMHGDPRYSRYFAYISLFTASMLGLVLADNFILLYIFWEGVGLCSYLLIAFWFERPAAAKAGLKAFITTRIGDTGFLIGIFLLLSLTHSLRFSDLAHVNVAGNETFFMVAALLIFFGAVGKSAQFPLHVWLPDAMEGPTAISALIHAATMVAAGVYLVARTFPLFLANPAALEFVGIIGGISALMAASIATVNNDIKRVLAYSTVSQLGLMMLGLGVGGYAAGTFHLMTHAFFKALLFLCAGSVIHAVHSQDIRTMGGLFAKMKITGMTFIIGALALAGVPPLAGFWSKDEILLSAYHGHQGLFMVAVLTSFLTAFYMARLIFLVLFGKPRSDISHAHESPVSMTFPLIVLSVFAIFVGLIGSPLAGHAFQAFILPHEGAHEVEINSMIMWLSVLIALTGIVLAFLVYMKGLKLPAFGGLYRLLLNKYYVDEIYQEIFVKPALAVCRGAFGFDFRFIDGIVNGTASCVQRLSAIFRPLQTGLVQNYLLFQVVGIIIFILILGGLCFRF